MASIGTGDFPVGKSEIRLEYFFKKKEKRKKKKEKKKRNEMGERITNSGCQGLLTRGINFFYFPKNIKRHLLIIHR